MRILLAEDEKSLSRAIVKILTSNNYSVDAVYDGEDAYDYILTGDYDAVILDIMMPKMDGISVLKKIRAQGNHIPILILSAKSEVSDKVLGLDNGADDYLSKPFDSQELLARLRLITREKGVQDNKLRCGNITLDRATFDLSSPTGSIRLTSKEFQMAEMFMANPHYVFSTERIMDKVWGYDCSAELNVVWVYLSYLRKKLGALHADIEIRAMRKVGYSLEFIND